MLARGRLSFGCRWWWTGALSVLLVTALRLTVASAQTVPQAEEGHDVGMALPLMLHKLDLSAQQKAQVDRILVSHRSRLEALFKQQRQIRSDITDKLLAPGSVTRADLAPLEQQVVQTRTQIMQEVIDIAVAIRGVLTPAQVAKASRFNAQVIRLHQQMRDLFVESPAGAPTPSK